MYVFFGTRRKLVWASLGILAAVSVVTGLLHGSGAVSGRSATLLIHSWSLVSFCLIAAIMLRLEPGYVPPIANIPFAKMRRAFLFMGGSAVLTTLLFGFMRKANGRSQRSHNSSARLPASSYSRI